MNDFEIGSHLLQSNTTNINDAYKLGYKQGQADLNKECEDLIIGFTKEEARRIRQNAIDEYSNKLWIAIESATVNCKLDFTIEDLRNIEIFIKGLAEDLKERNNE